MHKRNAWGAMLLVLPLAIVPAACSDKGNDSREALQEDELDRELDLALQGDSVPATFEDTAIGLAPSKEGTPSRAPTPTTRPRNPNPTPRPAPSPAPSRPEPAPSAPRTVTSTVPSGTTFAITLNETLSTRANSPGDAFTATLQEPIMDASGNVVVPAGATVRGRVTSVDKSDRVGETGVLHIGFESIAFGGKSYPLDATVVEANPQRKTRQSTGEQAGKVAAGAAAGAILGRVIGKSTKSTIAGAAVGAAAGTAIAMGTADVDVVLPAGSTMRVRMDGPISVRRTVS